MIKYLNILHIYLAIYDTLQCSAALCGLLFLLATGALVATCVPCAINNYGLHFVIENSDIYELFFKKKGKRRRKEEKVTRKRGF